MRHLKSNITIYLIITCFMTLFCQCEDQNKGSEELFNFPEIEHIDPTVYDEIKRTCEEYWDLSIMIDSTFEIYPEGNEYSVYCDGYLDEVLYQFVIRVDEYGKWIN